MLHDVEVADDVADPLQQKLLIRNKPSCKIASNYKHHMLQQNLVFRSTISV